jgi:CPA2 family monovalent cation:H+ antiporter-2
MAEPGDVSSYKDALVLLGTAGVVVPLMHKLRISPILGFLAAGAILGPKGLGAIAGSVPGLAWVTIDSDRGVHWLAELGILFLLFFIGLELSLPRLVTMRRLVFGLGNAQVALSTAVIGTIAALIFDKSAAASLLIGSCLALSSTAMVIELLAQQNRLTTVAGRASFSVLLLQDLAVVPILFLAGILGAKSEGSVAFGLIQALAQAAAVIGLIVAAGWLLLRPLFRLVANTGNEELFVATTLFVAIGTGVVTQAAGLSMALGAFIAGLLLAETEYRKAIEATVLPFKGLLLGVFFFSVGMLIDLSLLARSPLSILGAAIALIALKALILMPLCRFYGLSWPAAIETGLLLGPGGEFAFIVVGVALAYGILDWSSGSSILTVVALTMASIPLMAPLSQTAARRFSPAPVVPADIADEPPPDSSVKAIVVGHGRVGRLVAEMLKRHDIAYLAIEREPATVAKWRRRGRPVYYGDAKQAAFLRRCGIDKAAALILTIHSPSEIDEIVSVARGMRSDILIVARARDAEHAQHLYSRGVNDAVPETIEASLQLSEAVLVGLGVPTGLVIASIHEKRDEFRHELQSTAGAYGHTTHAVKKKTFTSAN